MAQELPSIIGDLENAYDRFVLAIFAACFQLAEVMLVIGAFEYASTKTGSHLLSTISFLLTCVASLWLGLILPSTLGRLSFWKKAPSRARHAFALFMIIASGVGGYFYLRAIKLLATSQLS